MGASAGPGADRSACDRGHPARFRGLARGFPWAWDEEAVAAVAHSPAGQSERLAAACPVVGAIAGAALRRGVRRAAGPERESLGAWDAKDVVERDAAHQESRELEAQQAARPQELRGQSSQLVLAQRASLREPRARGLWQAGALLARVSQPQVPTHVVLPEPPLVLGPLASPPRAVEPEEQQEPLAERVVSAKPPSPPLLSLCARLPPRFRRPRHPADDA